MKKATNQSGILLAIAQMRAHLPHQLKAMFGSAPTDGIGLGVVVEELVGIQVRPIGGKKEQLDLALLRRDPFANAAGPMNGVPVDDQKDLPMARLFEQTFEELKEDAQTELPLEDHEREMTPVGNRRDHIAAESLAGSGNHRRLAFGRIRTPRLMIGPQPHLVAPIKQGFLRFRPAMDARIFDFQPLFDRRRIGLARTTHRFLRSKAPAPKKPSHGRNRQGDPVTLADQVAAGRPCPQGERQFQLIRATVCDGLDDLPGHRLFELSASPGASLRPCPQGFCTTFVMRHHPFPDRLPGDAKRLGRFHLRHPRKHSFDRLASRFLLGFARPRPGVLFHASRVAWFPQKSNKKSKLFNDRISNR